MIDADDVRRLAEQATLGSLLYAPHAVADVSRWLRPPDFADSWHAHVFRLIHEHHRAGHPLHARDLDSHMLAVLGPRRADVAALHDLLAAAPTAPQPAVYGRMVLDSALRREIGGLGVLLEAGALQAAVTGGPAPLAHTSVIVDAGLDSCANRWQLACGTPPERPEPTGRVRAALTGRDLRLSADRYIRTHPSRDPVEERAHEARLVGALVAHPEAISAVSAWLPPGYVATPTWRTVYAATAELAELGQPVDLVTVADGTRRLGQHQPTPSLSELRQAVDEGRLVDARSAACDVAADQVRRIAENGARQLRAGAANPGVHVEDLVDTGHTVTTALRRLAQELPHASHRDDRPALHVVPQLAAAPHAVAQ